MSEALIVSRDAQLVEELGRLAAAAGASPEVVTDTAGGLRRWGGAVLVLLGADVAEEFGHLRPPRRAGVHIVSWGPVGHEIFKAALEVGAEDVAELPRSDAWLVELLGDLGETAAGLTVGVIGGSGGAGATVFACALGQVAARSGPALVIDTDPLGPGVDRILGLERAAGVRWDALQQTTGRLSAASLREAVPRRDGLGVLTWSPGPQGTVQAFALREALAAGQRGHDLVCLDLPRRPDPLLEEIAARCDHLVVVTVPTISGLSSTARLVARLGVERGHAGTMAAVVRGAGPGREALARAIGIPVLAEMSDQRGLAEATDLGIGPAHRRGPLARTSTEILQRWRVR